MGVTFVNPRLRLATVQLTHMCISRRTLKIAKWTAATLLALSIILWVIAANRVVMFRFSSSHVFGIGRGVIGIERFRYSWALFALSETAGNNWLRVPINSRSGEHYLAAWIPLAVMLPVTTVLFNADHRRSVPGHCRCGYDLTGNVSGRCPECGRETATEAAR